MSDEIVRGSPDVQPYLRKYRQAVYDEEQVGNGAATRLLQFFARPQGQADAAGIVKNARDTNLTVAGQLGARQEFYLVGFNIALDWDLLSEPIQTATYPATNTELYAIHQILTDGLFTFQFGRGQPLVEIPLDRIPFGMGPCGMIYNGVDAGAFGANMSHVLTNGVPSVHEFYDIRLRRARPRHIQYQQSFSAKIEWLHGNGITIGTSSGGEYYRVMLYALGILLSAL